MAAYEGQVLTAQLLPPDWVAIQYAGGEVYFYNERTNETVWEVRALPLHYFGARTDL